MMKREFNNRILVIDDEEVVRQSMREILMPPAQDYGTLDAAAAELFGEPSISVARSSAVFDFDVEEAATGKEGLDKLNAAREQGRPFALVFVDVRMPGWDGVQTAQNIRAVDPQVEIVFITAYSDYDLNEVVERVGANVGYHCKPFAPEEIRQIATKAAYDWHKLRSLESLISVVADLGTQRDHLETLLDNVLHQVADWTGTRSAAVLQRNGKQTVPVTAVGELRQPERLAPMISLLDEHGLPEDILQQDQWTVFALGDNAVVALLDPDTHLHTGRIYLVRLLLEHASRAIENARLHEALVRAQTLSSLGTAMSHIIHDLRQPLTVIDGMIELVPVAADENELHSAYQSIQDASRDLQRYVDSILTFARDEKLERKPTDIAPLFARIQERAEAMFRKDPVRVVVEVHSPITANIDAQKVQRAVLNLCKNSIEAIRDDKREHGVVTVVVQTTQEHETLLIRVSDDGPGIPPQVEHSLFEPFITHGKRHGTGLGLAIVAQICRSHGGTIECSPSEVGACFTIALPLA